uniref:Uncharacterized protein n=1 Tax=viral metagenome TaxID=1070528 RepID=A0A6C0B4Q2_9ZZZZ
MACFWEGILSSLSTVDKVKLGINNHIPNLIEALKKYNTHDITVLWQNKDISKKEKDENYTHINDYSVNSYNKGYLCSTCDPFLILVSHILHVDIHHEYLNNVIKYSSNSDKTYVFKSNSGHFTYKKKY